MDEIIGQLAGGGFGALDVPELARSAKAQREGQIGLARQEAQIVRSMAQTPEGKAYLEWLLRKTLLRPPSQAEASAATAEHYAILKARREGQNSIILMTLSAIALAEGDATEAMHEP